MADTSEVLGWSPDASRVALLQHGVREGSGFPFAQVTVYDVAKNAPAGKPVLIELEGEGAKEDEAVAQAKEKADELRASLQIDKWVPGKIIAHDEKGELREKEGAPIGTLEIKAKKAGKKERARSCDAPFNPLLLKVVIHWTDDDTPARVLDDKKVPASRACLTGCDLDTVYAHLKSALVLLKCGAPGFEGPASKVVPIAARLPYGLDEDLPTEPQAH